MVIVGVLAGLVALAVVVALYRYVWHRLVRDTTADGSALRRAGSALFVVGPLLMVGALVGERAGAPFWLQRVLGWPGFLWMALSLYLLLAVVVGELVRPLLRRWLERRAAPVAGQATALPAGGAPSPEARSAPDGGPSAEARSAPEAGAAGPAAAEAAAHERGAARETAPGKEPAGLAEGPGAPGTPDGGPSGPSGPSGSSGPSRRLLVSRLVGGAAAAAALGTVGHGTYQVLRGPRVKRLTVPLAKLPRGAHGFRVAVVSDIHLGPILGRDFTRRVVDTVNSTQPDLIAVVGDLVDGSVHDLGPAAAPLAGLRARFGTYFVTGNHEYYSGARQWVEHVRELGLIPLENARTELPGFDLAGVNDIQGESQGQGPDFGAALGDRDRSRTAVLLAHQPVVIHDAVRYGVDLQLSGHTHGGQLWPGNYLAALANPTVAGLERYGDTQLYVTRGAGAWGPPVRVGAPSDITVVELASRQA
ncbi:membrane protein [Streptomyces sulfonofaciens]|uniref:Membrane protein n=1 Tax=Streptomyces sulfonofaciens TaxID=68272 RepID=A0A919L080_9ACTN|nr:metallophosphoesterase [Streptomyces sulfonofaciens]GHH77891.1 membrane protein [Streptomyces sulfonofaciens]